MASFYFPGGAPAYMTGRMVEVYVDRNPLGDRPKGLQMVSPEEIVHSLIAASAEAIRPPVCMSKDTLDEDAWDRCRQMWKSVMLSIPVSMLDSNQDDEPDRVWVQAFNRRQSLKQDHESMVRTAMQTAIEIDQFRTIAESQPGSKGRLQPAQLAEEFVELGLVSVQGGGRKDDDNDGKLTPNLISQALACKKGILSSPRAVEILLEMESAYGTRSPFLRMSCLHVASTKPSTFQMRDWTFELLWDSLSHDLLKPGKISKTSLAGDKHHTGLDLTFGRKYDHCLRATCKSTGVPEAMLEQEQVQTAWTTVLDLLKNEEIERKAAVRMQSENDDGAGEQCELELLRKPPSQYSEGSEGYLGEILNYN
eukprot:s3895_g11.t1